MPNAICSLRFLRQCIGAESSVHLWKQCNCCSAPCQVSSKYSRSSYSRGASFGICLCPYHCNQSGFQNSQGNCVGKRSQEVSRCKLIFFSYLFRSYTFETDFCAVALFMGSKSRSSTVFINHLQLWTESHRFHINLRVSGFWMFFCKI